MFIEKIKTPGLSHLSYFVASGTEAFVVDPRRDVECYMELAQQHGCSITHIFETHRNEDLISGSPLLAKQSGAQVFHGQREDTPVKFAKETFDGEHFTIGNCEIQVLATPGHTKDSLSYLLFDTDFSNSPVGVFTGDTLFVGDVGRTDFYPDEKEAMAGSLYDSLQTIREKAPGAIIYPAHGAGSVCGDNMADREFSTVAHEFDNNPALLNSTREEFIAKKVREQHVQPPYFRNMEKLNLEGVEHWPVQRNYINQQTLQEYSEAPNRVLVDIRSTEAYLAGHIPGSICLPADMITAYAGWLLHWEDSLVLIGGTPGECELARCSLHRIGYDKVSGLFLLDPMKQAAQGKPLTTMKVVYADTVKQRVENDTQWTLLDVRKEKEVEASAIESSRHVFLGEITKELDQFDKDQHITVMCMSGKRATIGASMLLTHGFNNVDVFMGSMGAWKAA